MELKAFVTKIAEDPITTKAFGQDPAGTMEAAGLAPADRAAVMSQDRDVISKKTWHQSTSAWDRARGNGQDKNQAVRR
jgi:hypothetical protein